MNYWLISDTHFNHLKLEEWNCRSGNWQEQLWKGLSQIPIKDTLIHLGDVSIGDDASIHNRLCSFGFSKVLVRGNHDEKSYKWYAERGWNFVCDGLHLEYMGMKLLLTHRPTHPDMWNFIYNLHGHTHGNNHRTEEYHNWYTTDYHVDLSPEIVGYKPIRLDTLLKKRKL